MRWPSTKVNVLFGDERVREGFLWLPKRLPLGPSIPKIYQWRWLEYAQWVQWRGTDQWWGKHWS